MAQLSETYLINDSALRGYWRMESNWNDSSTSGYNLTAVNSPTFAVGKYGNAGNFLATSSRYSTIANASCANLEISGSQSWGCWMQVDNLSTGDAQVPMGKKLVGTGEIDIYKNSAVGGSMRFYVDGLTTTEVNSGFVPTAGVPFHVVGVYTSGATLAIYINGVKTSVASSGSHTDTNGDFSLGRNGGQAAGYLTGWVDDAFVFSRALTDYEVQLLYLPRTSLMLLGVGV